MAKLKIGGEIERVDGRSLTYNHFIDRYMKPNLPVVLTGLTHTWQSLTDWVQNSKPNLSFFSSLCSTSTVQVADCNKKQYSDQKRLQMTLPDFIRSWTQHSHDGSKPTNEPQSFLYLKDWHFVKAETLHVQKIEATFVLGCSKMEYPNYCAYTTPTFFKDDWLNIYLDSHTLHRDSDICPHQNEANCADYRFVYMGPKGTWTPLHADVFRSYSWSANVCGKKYWLLLPPSQSHLLFDRNGKSSIYSIYDDISEMQFPGFKKTVWLECTQESGDIIFVPSGWYHQVHNLEDTISINHNWFNGYNLSWLWKLTIMADDALFKQQIEYRERGITLMGKWNLLVEDYKIAKEYIEDIRDISDDFESLCQRNLAANTGTIFSSQVKRQSSNVTGMNFYDLFIFITRYALANIIELYHVPNSKIAIHLLHNLTSIQDVASKMTSEEAFSAQNLRSISWENYDAFSDIGKAFEENKFHELCEGVMKTYKSVESEEEEEEDGTIKFEMRNGIKKGGCCFSINCSKDDCDVPGLVKGLVSKISGPQDLVDLMGRVMESIKDRD